MSAAKRYVDELRRVVSFGKDSTLAQMIWAQIERAFVMGYQQGVEDEQTYWTTRLRDGR